MKKNTKVILTHEYNQHITISGLQIYLKNVGITRQLPRKAQMIHIWDILLRKMEQRFKCKNMKPESMR